MVLAPRILMAGPSHRSARDRFDGERPATAACENGTAVPGDKLWPWSREGKEDMAPHGLTGLGEATIFGTRGVGCGSGSVIRRRPGAPRMTVSSALPRGDRLADSTGGGPARKA